MILKIHFYFACSEKSRTDTSITMTCIFSGDHSNAIYIELFWPNDKFIKNTFKIESETDDDHHRYV